MRKRWILVPLPPLPFPLPPKCSFFISSYCSQTTKAEAGDPPDRFRFRIPASDAREMEREESSRGKSERGREMFSVSFHWICRGLAPNKRQGTRSKSHPIFTGFFLPVSVFFLLCRRLGDIRQWQKSVGEVVSTFLCHFRSFLRIFL